jgi:glycosyltransferase involved in cell wall biosynthesis
MHLKPGDNIVASYAQANSCFRWARRNGGKTFLDGGNSHPDNFWEILSEEHKRWKCPVPPVPKFYIERARRMMDDVDFVLSPSRFVSESFLSRGFSGRQILPVTYAVDLSTFTPRSEERPKNRPLTIVNTGSLSLRKGTPYLLEAFRLIRRQVPDARLLLTDLVSDSMKPLMAHYADLPIEWSAGLPHAALAERLRSADLFVLPSLEEGLARTALEAMACGLPTILTPNTGTAQFVEAEINGSVVPIRDPQAIAHRALAWWDRIRSCYRVPRGDYAEAVSPGRSRLLFEHALASALDGPISTDGLSG